jgi:hypothetical protein
LVLQQSFAELCRQLVQHWLCVRRFLISKAPRKGSVEFWVVVVSLQVVPIQDRVDVGDDTLDLLYQ